MGFTDNLTRALLVIAAIAFFLFATTAAALLFVGILALIVSKYGKILIPQRSARQALAASAMWSGAITTGCILGPGSVTSR